MVLLVLTFDAGGEKPPIQMSGESLDFIGRYRAKECFMSAPWVTASNPVAVTSVSMSID